MVIPYDAAPTVYPNATAVDLAPPTVAGSGHGGPHRGGRVDDVMGHFGDVGGIVMERHIVTVFDCACGARFVYLPHEDATSGIHAHLAWAHRIVHGVVPRDWRSQVRHWTVIVGRRMSGIEARDWWLRKGDGRWTGSWRA